MTPIFRARARNQRGSGGCLNRFVLSFDTENGGGGAFLLHIELSPNCTSLQTRILYILFIDAQLLLA
jgi:hypothetical protein